MLHKTLLEYNLKKYFFIVWSFCNFLNDFYLILADPTDFVSSKIFKMWQYFIPTHFIVEAKKSPEEDRHPGDRAL